MTFILEDQRGVEFAGSQRESVVWPELDPQLADSHASAPHMSLYSLTVGSPPFRTCARPRPHLPWGTGNDGHAPFQTTGEIFCLGWTRIRPEPQVRRFQSYAKGGGYVSWIGVRVTLPQLSGLGISLAWCGWP